MTMMWLIGEEPAQIGIVDVRELDGVFSPTQRVVLVERARESMQRLGDTTTGGGRPLSPDLLHQLIDVFQLAHGRPAFVATAPIGSRTQPDGEGFSEILVRMTLRVPEPQVLDVAFARRVWPIVFRIP